MYNFVEHSYGYNEIYHLVSNKCYINWCSQLIFFI